jgi:transposase-like protein
MCKYAQGTHRLLWKYQPMRPSFWVKCPACQRVTGMLDISLSRREDHYECQDCGHVWMQPSPAPTKDAWTDRVIARQRKFGQ